MRINNQDGSQIQTEAVVLKDLTKVRSIDYCSMFTFIKYKQGPTENPVPSQARHYQVSLPFLCNGKLKKAQLKDT